MFERETDRDRECERAKERERELTVYWFSLILRYPFVVSQLVQL